MAATFTVPACPEIEDRIASDLALIRAAVLELTGTRHIRALVLGGGFGRGEGTAFLADGRPHIVNDYDIRVVHDLPGLFFKARYSRQLDAIAEQVAQRLQIKQIDLGGQNYHALEHVPAPTIANYEFFHGYRIFYGEDLLGPVRERIPVEYILQWEGTWLLRNRAIGLILAGLYFIGRPLPEDDRRENLWIEANKAILAVGDSFLLAQGQYHWSYVERGRRVANWPGEEAATWREAYCEAVARKVNPGGCPYDRPVNELVQGWYRARDIIEQGFRWFEMQRTGRPVEHWGAYLDHCVEGVAWRRPIFWANILRANTLSPAAALRMASIRTARIRSVGLAARLLFAVREDGIDAVAVDHVAQVVRMQLAGSKVERWRRLAALLIASIHPNGEAGKVAHGNL